MKKVFFISFFVLTNLFIFTPISYADTSTIDLISGCTGFESSAICRPEWIDAQIGCLTNSYNSTNHTCTKIINGSSQTIAVCDAGNTTGPCRPSRVNATAAANDASRAETILRNHGYTDVSCVSTRESWAAIGYDTNTGLQYYYNSLCTVNGKSGISAELLVNNTESALRDTDNYVNGKSSVVSSTNNTPTAPIAPTVPSGQIPVNQNYISYATSLISIINNMITNLKNQLNAIDGKSQTTTSANVSAQTTTSYVSSVSRIINDMATNLKNQLNSINNGQTATTASSGQTQIGIVTSTTPSVELTLGSGLKSGTYSIGDTIIYQVKMQNVDSVNSFYSAIPKDTCAGGSISGEQKPWIVRAVAPISVFNDQVKSCQAGSTYVISVVGTNKTSGIINASSVSVYIRK
ncbi:MAG: hypothetical protein M1338_05150 [Patescibacteria group bacterium]|nr:hypothetical protein [Patescibacteria group bacterium]